MTHVHYALRFNTNTGRYEIREIVVDTDGHDTGFGRQVITMSPQEWDKFAYTTEGADEVRFQYEELAERVLGIDSYREEDPDPQPYPDMDTAI